MPDLSPLTRPKRETLPVDRLRQHSSQDLWHTQASPTTTRSSTPRRGDLTYICVIVSVFLKGKYQNNNWAYVCSIFGEEGIKEAEPIMWRTRYYNKYSIWASGMEWTY